jgi:glycosyltransferase involved in cell wall biosynthesis
MSITIICSNYNSKKWIDGYLESLNAQTLKEFSVVFIDANSTDNSLKTIKSFDFRGGISTIILEFKDRINIYEAWNEAVKVSKTDYVVNLNTDDRLYPESLSKYSAFSSENPDVDLFYSPCDIKGDESHKDKIGEYNWPEYSHEILSHMCICGPFPMLKKASVERAGLFDPKYPHSADYEMWIRMSFMGMKFLRIDESLGTYYKNPTGMSTNPENLQKAQAEDREIQSKYKIKPKINLSILVCSIDSRKDYLERLKSILVPQLEKRKEEAQLIVFEDNRESSIGAKRNALLSFAEGEYVCFVDDDDIVSDDYVDLILDAIEKRPDVVGIHLLHFEDGVHKGLTYHSLKYDHWWDEVNKDNPQLKNYYRNPNHLNPVRKEYAVRTMFPEINMGEDKQYSMGILKYLKTESYIERPIYTYLFRTTKEC